MTDKSKPSPAPGGEIILYRQCVLSARAAVSVNLYLCSDNKPPGP